MNTKTMNDEYYVHTIAIAYHAVFNQYCIYVHIDQRFCLISMTAILSPPNYPYFDLVGRGLGIVHFPYLPCQVPPCTLIC